MQTGLKPKLMTNQLVRRVYALTDKTDIFEAERIRQNCEKFSIPFSWVPQIPQSSNNGVAKLEEERGILVILNRRSPFIEKFRHPKGLCYPFYKLTAHNSCNFWCEYCYLYMTFYMRPQSLHYVNYSKMFKEIEEFDKVNVQSQFRVLNLGELGDPLATDDITGFSTKIIPFVAKKQNVKLLFLTKSSNVDNLLDLEHNNRTILSWSINCALIAEKLEHRTPSPIERILSAAKAQESGYEIRFRIDPLFWFEGWREQYAELVYKIAEHAKPSLITLGAYRPSTGLVNHIKARFPRSNLISLEKKLVIDTGKKRFSDEQRIEMYEFLTTLIKDKIGNIRIGLCKEPRRIWNSVGLETAKFACNCVDFAH